MWGRGFENGRLGGIGEGGNEPFQNRMAWGKYINAKLEMLNNIVYRFNKKKKHM